MSGIGSISGNNDYTSYGKIASGNRISRAADDPAGAAIASKQEAQIRASRMEARNQASYNDMANIADGALGGVNDYLQRANELSIQSMNGLYSDSDRQAIANEMSQMAAGIDGIVSTTRYNETSPLAGMSSRSMGLTGNFNTEDIDSAMNSVNATRSQYGAETNGREASINSSAVYAENTTAALSRTADLDMGEAVTELKRKQALDEYQTTMQRRQMDDEKNQMNRLFGSIA